MGKGFLLVGVRMRAMSSWDVTVGGISEAEFWRGEYRSVWRRWRDDERRHQSLRRQYGWLEQRYAHMANKLTELEGKWVEWQNGVLQQEVEVVEGKQQAGGAPMRRSEILSEAESSTSGVDEMPGRDEPQRGTVPNSPVVASAGKS